MIKYNPHRIETTVPMYLGTCTWGYGVTWNGFRVAYCVWVTG